MPSDSKLERLFLQMIRHTTEGNVEWQAVYPPVSLTTGTDDIVQDYFETTYKGYKIAVFERRYRDYDGDHDLTYWSSRDCLAFLSEDRSVTWESSDDPGRLSTLLKVARESAADVDGILDTLLD